MSEGLIDVSLLPVWSVSSAIIGHGIIGLLNVPDNEKKEIDSSGERYWQSDGEKPHMIGVFFHTAQRVSMIKLKINPFLDESYTPSIIRIRTGQTPFTTEDVLRTTINLTEISTDGWIDLTLPKSKEELGRAVPIRVIQIEIEDCLESGKDTRLRGIKLYAEPLI